MRIKYIRLLVHLPFEKNRETPLYVFLRHGIIGMEIRIQDLRNRPQAKVILYFDILVVCHGWSGARQQNRIVDVEEVSVSAQTRKQAIHWPDTHDYQYQRKNKRDDTFEDHFL